MLYVVLQPQVDDDNNMFFFLKNVCNGMPI